MNDISARLSNSQRNDIQKRQRHVRLGRGIYGVVKQPVLPPFDGIVHCHPRYSDSARVQFYRRLKEQAIVPDLRCFYLGVVTNVDAAQMDPLKNPWFGTRDHLVPLRRDVPNSPHHVHMPGGGKGTTVWASNIANVTLGLAPLPVRLTIRHWLEETTYDRTDDSVTAGINLRWLIIKYLDHFRIGRRFPWSRRSDGQFWEDGIQVPFMRHVYHIEQQFLHTRFEDRDRFIQRFHWLF